MVGFHLGSSWSRDIGQCAPEVRQRINGYENRSWSSWILFIFFLLFSPLKRHQTSTMEVEDGEDGASAGRGEGGSDAPAAHARPSECLVFPKIVNFLFWLLFWCECSVRKKTGLRKSRVFSGWGFHKNPKPHGVKEKLFSDEERGRRRRRRRVQLKNA